MPTEITMPKLSDTMEEGTILRWYKHAGDHVERGEVLAEVETDKADMELEAERSGTLREVRVQEGHVAAVGAVIAVLDDGAAAEQARTAAAPAPTASNASAPTAPAPPPPPRAAAPPARAASVLPPPPQTASTPRPPAPSAERGEVSKLRLAVAKQMALSKREIPHFYVTSEVDMSEAARLRAPLAASGAMPEHITFTHLLIRALAMTLPRHPRLNASWSERGVEFHDDVNIAIAVAVDDGLLAPVLRGCQAMTLRQIARAAADLIEKAQAGRFGGEALTGGTFSLSNMGMLDIEEFSAVIIPPQAAILAVGAIKERPVVRNGQLAVAKTMRVTLSADHRVVNGIEAGRFLEALKAILETPVQLVIAGE